MVGYRVFDDVKIQALIDRSVKLMKSNDCVLAKIREVGFDEIEFKFEKKHRYFKTTYTCAFYPNSTSRLIFEEFATSHSYDNLLADDGFRQMIGKKERETGFTFMECAGGYGSELDNDHYYFIFNSKIDLTVRFDMGEGKIAVYDLDLDSMKLGEECRVY